MKTFTASTFGRLFDGTTADLVASHARYSAEIAEIDSMDHRDAYAFQCAQNDRVSLVRKVNDLGKELRARLDNPLRSYALSGVIREDEIDWFSSKFGAKSLQIYANNPKASGMRTQVGAH